MDTCSSCDLRVRTATSTCLPTVPNARICTYECTWCATCAEDVLRGVCPNCGGNLVPRPIGPSALLVRDPPSTTRVFSPVAER